MFALQLTRIGALVKMEFIVNVCPDLYMEILFF